MKRELIEYVEAVDEVRAAEGRSPISDEDHAESVAFVFLGPWALLRVCWRSFHYKYLRFR